MYDSSWVYSYINVGLFNWIMIIVSFTLGILNIIMGFYCYCKKQVGIGELITSLVVGLTLLTIFIIGLTKP